MPTLTEPPDGWGYPERQKVVKTQGGEYTKDDFNFELWVDDQIDQLREYEKQEAWENGEDDEDDEDE
jgi:hypothetical protein